MSPYGQRFSDLPAAHRRWQRRQQVRAWSLVTALTGSAMLGVILALRWWFV